MSAVEVRLYSEEVSLKHRVRNSHLKEPMFINVYLPEFLVKKQQQKNTNFFIYSSVTL